MDMRDYWTVFAYVMTGRGGVSLCPWLSEGNKEDVGNQAKDTEECEARERRG